MCEECGCGHEEKRIEVNLPINAVNDAIAHEISHNLKDKGIFCVNLLGSPGSGKTTVIEGLSKIIGNSEMIVIQGDLESDVDKIRLEKSGIETYQINTHSGCHLNSSMINKALMNMNLSDKKYLIIENVGNLVCPAGVKIGQHMNMVVSSTTEGSDKPKKYPLIFMDSKLAVISKSDLADAVGFDEEQYVKDITHINGKIKIIKTSSKDSKTFLDVAGYLKHQREHFLNIGHKH